LKKKNLCIVVVACKHPCLVYCCVTMIVISQIISAIISIVLMAIILMSWGNKEEEICYSINNLKTQHFFLANSEEVKPVPAEKKLQIVSQNDICHVLM
jgi:hypothetical protein